MYMLYEYLSKRLLPVAFLLCVVAIVTAQEKETRRYKNFQFPSNKIPSIDGNKTDCYIVLDSFLIGTYQLVDNNGIIFMSQTDAYWDVKIG